MKKWTKIMLITGMICFAVGLAICIVTSAFGAGTVAMDMAADGKLSLAHVPSWVHFEIGDFDFDEINGTKIENSDEMIALTKEANQISALDLEIGGVELVLRESEDENFYLQNQTNIKMEYKIDGKTLRVQSKNKHATYNGMVYLYMPKDYRLEELDIELGAGAIENETEITASTLNITVGAGQVILSDITADTADFELGAGQLELTESTVTNLDAEISMGEMIYEGSILGDTDAECAMGSIQFDLEGEVEDFNYNVECGAGDVTIDGNSFAGIVDHNMDHHAKKNMNIDCSMGAISVNFDSLL